MPDEPDATPTQPIQPKQGEPVEVPVPTRDDWDKVLKRTVQPQDEPDKDQGDPADDLP